MRKVRLLNVLRMQFFALLILSVQPAFAVSSFETDATRDTASGAASDSQGPAITGSLHSEVLVPETDGGDSSFSVPGFARSAADDMGRGAVGVDGNLWSGQPTLYSLTADSTLTSEITNTFGGVVPYEYEFFLPGPRLILSDGNGMSETDVPTIVVSFDFKVSLDFGSGYQEHVRSIGVLTGGRLSHSLERAGTDPLNSTFFEDNNSTINFGYQFQDLSSSVTGSLDTGETVKVRSSLSVRLHAPGFETGGAARIGEPTGLSSGAFSGSLSILSSKTDTLPWLPLLLE